jgi:tellurite resistance protein TerC
MNMIYPTLVVVGGAALLVDFFGHKKGEVMSIKTASLWSVFWILCGILMGGLIYLEMGATAASQYFAGYAMEKALSVDNLMVFSAIFAYYKIKKQDEMHTVLTYGIIGAIVFRAIFVFVGAGLFNSETHLGFSIFGLPVTLHLVMSAIFAAIIFWGAWKMLSANEADDESEDYDNVWYNRLVRRFFPKAGAMFFAAVTIELSDVVFSFDSVPAVIAVAKDTAVVYSAMLMAVLGLRALFFVLEALMKHLCHLEKAVVAILVFIGIKLIAEPLGLHISPMFSVSVVLGLLAVGVIASWLFPSKE